MKSLIPYIQAIAVLVVFQSNGVIEWIIGQSDIFSIEDIPLYVLQTYIMIVLIAAMKLTTHPQKYIICAITGISLIVNMACISTLFNDIYLLTRYYNAIDNTLTALVVVALFWDGRFGLRNFLTSALAYRWGYSFRRYSGGYH